MILNNCHLEVGTINRQLSLVIAAGLESRLETKLRGAKVEIEIRSSTENLKKNYTFGN